MRSSRALATGVVREPSTSIEVRSSRVAVFMSQRARGIAGLAHGAGMSGGAIGPPQIEITHQRGCAAFYEKPSQKYRRLVR
jgi:hypothetical protein